MCKISIANLQKIDVARNEIIFKVERESTVAVVRDVLGREVHRNFHGDRSGIVDEHELLERLVPFLVRDGAGNWERKTYGVVLKSLLDWPARSIAEVQGALQGGRLGIEWAAQPLR